jgi:hypothetical protein
MPQALLMSPRWGLKIVTLGYERFLKNILNVGITWIAWGDAPGFINVAPLGLEDSYIRL